MELTAVADELYALTPDAFTRTRNERAKEAKAQDKALGSAIARLPKPSTAAWLVNALVRHHAEELEQVLALGAALRQAQDNLDGAELRELNKQRRRLTAAVTTQARGLASELGVKVSDAVAGQAEETLRAAMTDEGAARAVRTGQLVGALSATGVGELDVSAAVAVPESIGISAQPASRTGGDQTGADKPPLTVVEDEPGDSQSDRVRLLDQARRAAEDAQAASSKAEKKWVKTQKRVADLEARSLQLQAELEELRRRAGDLEHALETVDDELTSAEEKRDRAGEKRASAKKTADQARAAAERLEAADG